MYSANELYKMKEESVSFDLEGLRGVHYDHLPEIKYVGLWNLNNELITIKTLKYFDFDGRRLWLLRTVWFKDSPVMIIQNAGRGGEDHYERFITNATLFKDMLLYICSLQVNEDINNYAGVFNPDTRDESLTSFYGNDLDGKFEKY
jgi:hypothetical protein